MRFFSWSLLLLSLAIITISSISINTNADVFDAVNDLVTREDASPHESLWRDILSLSSSKVKGSDKNCAACTLVIGLIEQLAIDNNQSLKSAAENWCTDATVDIPLLTGICKIIIDGEVAKLQADFNAGKSPDYSCLHTLNMCANPQCSLFPQWPIPHLHQQKRIGHPTEISSKLPLWLLRNFFQDELNQVLKYSTLTMDDLLSSSSSSSSSSKSNNLGKGFVPKPLVDADGDGHAPSFTLRGLQWRGKDCNDKDPNTYPGRIAQNGDVQVDSNCNGIVGSDSHGNSYEEQYCSGENSPRGIVIVGDSATAHFSLPPTWFHPQSVNSTDYADLIDVALTEADWPQCSWSTGWQNDTTKCPPAFVPMNSIYQRMKERNLCMHRDYQNHGVNGASSRNTMGNMISGLHARNGTDTSALIFFAMIGNDVCGAKQFGEMTTPQEFYTNILEILQYIDQKSAADSYLVAQGLVDGRVLYDSVHEQIHPLGMTYKTFYDYLNCLDVSPCWGWMNSNETIRNTTTSIAESLSAQYDVIFQNNQFKNFQPNYVYPDFVGLMEKWVANGGHAYDLIEKMDGFHPSQTGQQLLAGYVWNWLESNFPQALGNVNPFNAQIAALFGDQGGYE